MMSLEDYGAITQTTYNKAVKRWIKGHNDLEYWRDEFERFDLYCEYFGLKDGTLGNPNSPAEQYGTILDVGCGFGRDFHLFKEEGYEYIGVDFSRKLLTEGRRRFPEAQFVHGDIKNLPFAGYKFDGFWAAASLLHIEKKDIRNVLRGIDNFLKDSAIGFISLKEGEGERVVFDKKIGPRFFAYYTESEFLQVLRDCDFFVLETAKRERGDDTTWLEFFVTKL